ncbi:ABC transporter substrate-binding protein [Amycolatopsis thermophila]|uniref:Branched-chain amino acid transport system substrate-binding protein n=1 Tax=Amycolatopsis thermophila TaxID=206084 RepID=A0ABU0F128_9PSEU|nr:ABC transporter substrate-binding protein [Amycolatopsis thermophila]MDQ0381083.1 branched-chain amino acid transport system substrate-binding protein [Amycolatopsis thermophila]
MTRSPWQRRLAPLVIAIVVGGTATACSHEASRQAAADKKCGTSATAPAAPAAAPNDGTVPTPNPDSKNWGRSAEGTCVYTGPGGFSLDLGSCPATWDNNAGITAGEIKLFTSMPHSGPLAAYGAISDGIKTYFDYVNSHGGVQGRRVSIDVKDDQYQPDQTRNNVEAAAQSGAYAASFAVLGSPNNLNLIDYMNQTCTGQFMVAASDNEFGDPQHHPWTTGFGLDYYNESGIWASWIKERFPQGAKVATISIGNALGHAYINGFKRAVAATPGITIVDEQTNDVTAPNVDNEVTSAAASRADVVVLAEAGTFCTQAIGAIEKSPWKPVVVAAQPCAQIQTTYAPLGKQGLTGNGTNVVRYYYAPSDPDNPNTGFAKLYTDTVSAAGLDPKNAQIANGWFWAWYIVQALQDASTMKGGLNRANINIAVHSYDSTYPLMVEGVKGRVSGVEDAYPFEAGRMYTYTGATPASTGHFEGAGPLIDNGGKLGNWPKAQG